MLQRVAPGFARGQGARQREARLEIGRLGRNPRRKIALAPTGASEGGNKPSTSYV